MKLDEAQKQQVARWIVEGLKLSEIQNRVAAELGVTLTYMEVRFLVDDLKLMPKDPEPPKIQDPVVKEPSLKEKAPAPAVPSMAPLAASPAPEESIPGLAPLTLTVDQITKPGALVSGKVNFSDGQLADWYLDQTGRLGLAPKQQGYRPSPSDVQEFQLALEQELRKAGF